MEQDRVTQRVGEPPQRGLGAPAQHRRVVVEEDGDLDAARQIDHDVLAVAARSHPARDRSGAAHDDPAASTARHAIMRRQRAQDVGRALVSLRQRRNGTEQRQRKDESAERAARHHLRKLDVVLALICDLHSQIPCLPSLRIVL
ncbi:hypothetical protein ACFPOB_16535 [Bosea eneae]|uniref:Uncharacterized protein n=1 Tax=Bosea eneae TaxID=151454 RepID=A0ABW0IZB0_9HYPH